MSVALAQEFATEKQVSFIKSLGNERISPTGSWKWGSDPDYFHNLTKAQASSVITKMLALPRKPKETLPIEVPKAKPVEGIHVVHTSKGTAYVKVQKALYGSGRLYSKVWSPSAHQFVRVSGWLAKVNEGTLMSKEEAKKFGDLYGVCCRCSRPLTDEESIAAGVGPVCITKMGF